MSSDTDASETGGSSGLVNATSHTGFDWPNNTAVVPMTTPFAMPSGCLDYNGGTVSIDSSQLYSVSNNTFAVGTTLRMNEDVLQRPSCLPSGIQNATYFPAVCPSGWTYYSMVPPDSYTWLTTNSTLGYPAMMTTAYCCPSGYTMFVPSFTISGGLVPNCSRQITAGQLSVTVAVANESSSAVTAFRGAATLLYPPMAVSWISEAVETMSPEPPFIDQNSFVPTWVPGTPAQQFLKRAPQPLSSHGSGLATTVFVAVIAVPILMFILILGICICCFRSRRRKEKREIEKERVESEAAAAAAAAAAASTAAVRTTTTIDTSAAQHNRQSRVEGEAEAGASAQGHSPMDPFDDSMAIQRPSAEHHTPVHPLAGFVKPPYPGLPSHGFDGIDEPPPYMESASYDAARAGLQGQTPQQASQQTQHNTEREAHG